ncbi:MAG: hypothetical protein HONBIEJF_01686 [Fimbriimonadaceae bacterium]|nr:hypothetical protein [Fimbriimonadaceae bacterium]
MRTSITRVLSPLLAAAAVSCFAEGPPVPRPDAFAMRDGVIQSFKTLANDKDPDPYDVLTVKSVTQPAHGQVTIDSSKRFIRVEPNAGFKGNLDFQYQVTDGKYTVASSVTVEVVPLPIQFQFTIFDFEEPFYTNDSAPTLDGGTLLCATRQSDKVGLLIRLDSAGQELWRKVGAGGQVVDEMPSGDIVIAGAGSDKSVSVTILDQVGNVKLTKEVLAGGTREHVSDLKASSHGIFIACRRTHIDFENQGYAVLCLSSSATLKWHRYEHYNGSYYYPTAITIDSNGNSVVFGYHVDSNSGYLPFAARFDQDGNQRYSKFFGGYPWNRNEIGTRDVAFDANSNNLVLTVERQDDDDLPIYTTLHKVSESGNILGTLRIFEPIETDSARMAIGTGGDIIVAARDRKSPDGLYWVGRVARNLDRVKWQRSFSNGHHTAITAPTVVHDGLNSAMIGVFDYRFPETRVATWCLRDSDGLLLGCEEAVAVMPGTVRNVALAKNVVQTSVITENQNSDHYSAVWSAKPRWPSSVLSYALFGLRPFYGNLESLKRPDYDSMLLGSAPMSGLGKYSPPRSMEVALRLNQSAFSILETRFRVMADRNTLRMRVTPYDFDVKKFWSQDSVELPLSDIYAFYRPTFADPARFQDSQSQVRLRLEFIGLPQDIGWVDIDEVHIEGF